MDPVVRYLAALHTTGSTAEQGRYTALANLLDEIGATLRPRVRSESQLQDLGAGSPDLGLFVEGQPAASRPERGVVEVKAPDAPLDAIIAGQQVARYAAAYRQVLVTNYWDFSLVEQEAGGVRQLERFSLAADENAFWLAAANPRRLAAAQGEQLLEFLRRALLRPVPISQPRELAWFLASYARDALARLRTAAARGHAPALAQVRAALEDSLGVSFQGDEGERFFQSTLVQTLFYGIFSAWVIWHEERPGRAGPFQWRTAAWELHVPVIAELYERLSTPTRVRELDVEDVLDRVGDVLNRVERGPFFSQFDLGQAVQYFYEPFLEAFSPELRKELGVWYTPPEVVAYMVERVDHVLRAELGIAAGLADPNVYVLDPASGTGAYLVAVLSKIAATTIAAGDAALAAAEVKRAALTRVFGFELLPAPFVIAHLQLGLLLKRLGAPLAPGERASVYLTNALTGWQEKQHVPLPFAAFEQERDAAEQVKQQRPILVVLGNPPYNSFAGVAIGEERDLSNAYRETRTAPRPQGHGLNDLYVRFFRMAERAIVEMAPGYGLVCYISNYSWLDGLSFPGMRERFLDVFDQIWIDRLNGDKYKTGKLTPDGKPDPSIFSTEWNREGIQVGTAIALLLRGEGDHGGAAIHFRDLWGVTKRRQLLEESARPGALPYQPVTAALPLGLPFAPTTVQRDYLDWPRLPELLPVFFAGVKTGRDEVLVDIDREALEARMNSYFDPEISHEELRRIAPRLIQDGNRFHAISARETLLRRGFLPNNIVRYSYRPFDVRWLYWEPQTKLVHEKSPEFFPHVFQGNIWLASQRRPRREWSVPQVVQSIGCLDLMDRGASFFPLNLAGNDPATPLFARTGAPQPNLSRRALAYLGDLGAAPEDLFYHAVATLHAPAYRQENAGALRQDWPRVPLPTGPDVLARSAALGRQVAALLNPETNVPGVTSGAIPPHLAAIAAPAHVEGQPLDPARHFAVTANWGFPVRDGAVVMPGSGAAPTRDYTPGERAALGDAVDLLGPTTTDLYLNDEAYWRNVPAAVYAYTLGGYPVLKKWLSYRDHRVLGRPLRLDEVRHVSRTARRIAALLLLSPALDAAYRATAGLPNPTIVRVDTD